MARSLTTSAAPCPAHARWLITDATAGTVPPARSSRQSAANAAAPPRPRPPRPVVCECRCCCAFIRYEHRSLQMDPSNRTRLTATPGDAHDNAVTFAVTAPANRDRVAGHLLACLPGHATSKRIRWAAVVLWNVQPVQSCGTLASVPHLRYMLTATVLCANTSRCIWFPHFRAFEFP